jgi:hypothetical protein
MGRFCRRLAEEQTNERVASALLARVGETKTDKTLLELELLNGKKPKILTIRIRYFLRL